MKNILHDGINVKQNIVNTIPDDAYLFDPNRKVSFLNTTPEFNHLFENLFIPKGTREVQEKYQTFCGFLYSLADAFLENRSISLCSREHDKYWYVRKMIPILEKENYIQIRKGFFKCMYHPSNRLTRVYPTMKTLEKLFPMGHSFTILPEPYPFIFKDAVIKIKKNNRKKRTWKINIQKSKRYPVYIQRSYKLLYQLSEFNAGQLYFGPDVLPAVLYRVFNGNWKSNGRIYVFNDKVFTPFRLLKPVEKAYEQSTDIEPVQQNYQSFSKKDRKHILIGGEEGVEIDFVGMHPRMLYALKANIQYDKDPYLEIVQDPELRNFAKKILYCAFYSTDKTILKQAIQNQIYKASYSIKEKLKQKQLDTHQKLLIKMEEVHKPIAKYFGSDISLSLCFTESEIMLDVTRQLYKNDIHFMLIHDSIRVPEDTADFVTDLMHEMYTKHTKFKGQITVD